MAKVVQEQRLGAAAPAADASTSGSMTVAAKGFVNLVAPERNADGLRAALFGRVTVTRARVQNLVIPLWAAYIGSNRGMPSKPGIPVDIGDTITLTVGASTAWAGVAAQAPAVLVRIEDEPTPAPELTFEVPGPDSGLGDQSQVDLGNPAAGAQYAARTVGAQTIERVEGMSGTFARAIAVNDSLRFLLAITNGTNADEVAMPFTFLNSGTGTYDLGAARGNAGNTDSTAQHSAVGLPSTPLPPAATWQFQINAIDGTDNLGQGYARVMRWATL